MAAEFTFVIADEDLPTVLESFALQYDYDPASGVDLGVFAKQKAIEFVRGVVASARAKQLISGAQQTAAAEANALSIE